MEIKPLTANSLSTFIASQEYASMPNVPISRHRAISHIHNPYVREDDVIILLAYEGLEMVGYLGIGPEDIHTSPNAIAHIGWMSCIWAHPEHRGKGIAAALIKKAFELYSGRLIATEYTPQARAMYIKSGAFNVLATLKGYRMFLYADLTNILPARKTVFKRLKPILSLADACINSIWRRRVKTWPGNANSLLHYIISTEINEEVASFISRYNNEELCKRGSIGLSWILSYPWLLERQPDNESRRYHFSAYDCPFFNKSVQLRDSKNKLRGYMLLMLRGKDMKISYLYLDDSLNIEEVIPVLIRLMEEYKASNLLTYHPLLANYFQKHQTPFLYRKERNREYLSGQGIDLESIKGKTIQAGDMDCAFT